MGVVKDLERTADDFLAAAQVGIALLVMQRPLVRLLHVSHVAPAPCAAQRAEHEIHRRLAALFQQRLHFVQYAQVAPDALAQHRPGDVREDPRRLFADQIFRKFLQQRLAVFFFLERNFLGGNPVVHQVDHARPLEVRIEKFQFRLDEIAHRKDVVAEPRRRHQRSMLLTRICRALKFSRTCGKTSSRRLPSVSGLPITL